MKPVSAAFSAAQCGNVPHSFHIPHNRCGAGRRLREESTAAQRVLSSQVRRGRPAPQPGSAANPPSAAAWCGADNCNQRWRNRWTTSRP
jgi:hypothetical protein